MDLPLAILGIPISNMTIDEASERISALIDAYRKDLRPRHAIPVTSDFLTQAHSWNYGEVRFPELLHILREASLASADSMSLIWLSTLLGEPLKERVTGIDLLNKLSEALGKRKKSIYLLGGNEKALRLCSLYLQALYPELKIAGTGIPHIFTQGAEVHQAEEKDALLVDQINRASPDVLILNLSRPAQEIWFNRIRDRLHVPITLGVEGAFENLTGIAPPVPRWMQRWGLTWFYRLIQEPSLLWKHHAKMIYISTPLVLYHNLNRLLFRLFYWRNGSSRIGSPKLFISAHQTMAVLKLPIRLNLEACQEIADQADDLFSQDIILFDFQKVRHIDLTGMGLIVRFWQRAVGEKRQLYGINLSDDMALLMRLHRIWDLVRDSICPHLHDLVTRLTVEQSSGSLYDSIQQEHHSAVISFFGHLDHRLDVEAYLKKIDPIIHQKPCILDLTYCTYIDNRAIGFLVKLAEKRARQQVPLKIAGISPSLKRQLRIAKVASLFEFI
ncbi:MAG: WecB/TagA/CpsF family glycosyltransferase [Parachlamydia sp.]|nr:WecB/TagA/CpsF family glycosyltransferase [Parachlamydia sp.]